MDFFDACKVVARRWYVVAPLLLLTVLGTYLAYSAAGGQYSASGSTVLLAPTPNPNAKNAEGQPVTGCDTNPWCSGNDLTSLGDVTAKSTADDAVVERLTRAHPGSTFTVELDPNTRSPILNLSVTGSSPAAALSAMRDLRKEVDGQLANRQRERGVAPDALITSSSVTTPLSASAQTGGKQRVGAVALALGLAITLGAAFLAESIAKSRRDDYAMLERLTIPSGPIANADDDDDADADATSVPIPTPFAEREAVASTHEPSEALQRRSGRIGS